MAGGTESWGRYPAIEHRAVLPHSHVDTAWPSDPHTLLPRGNGRSYGDSASNADGILLVTTRMDRLLAFEPATGVLRAEAGVLLADVIDRFLPLGWFPAVVSGTRWITLGGAVANDVHGKNHRRQGTFGAHVSALGLRRSDGSYRELRAGEPDRMFEATVGGLGLTGMITWVEFRLRRVIGPWIQRTRHRLANVDEYFEYVQCDAAPNEYFVAWIDCLATGKHLGRGYLDTADHAENQGKPLEKPGAQVQVPFTPHVGLVNRFSLIPLNAACYALAPERPRRSVVNPYAFFFPLDRVGGWNRLYGPRGFVQYQCVVPKSDARPVIRALLQAIADAGRGSMLAVLKEFGSTASPGLLSFPMEGTTLALDFPSPDAELFRLFDRLDAILAEADGRIYPAKDARWPGRYFRSAYPAWPQVEALRDPAFSSTFWRRALA